MIKKKIFMMCTIVKELELPPFLPEAEEVTGNPAYSMYNLSLLDQTQCLLNKQNTSVL